VLRHTDQISLTSSSNFLVVGLRIWKSTSAHSTDKCSKWANSTFSTLSLVQTIFYPLWQVLLLEDSDVMLLNQWKILLHLQEWNRRKEILLLGPIPPRIELKLKWFDNTNPIKRPRHHCQFRLFYFSVSYVKHNYFNTLLAYWMILYTRLFISFEFTYSICKTLINTRLADSYVETTSFKFLYAYDLVWLTIGALYS
jgi:hypothetical protein